MVTTYLQKICNFKPSQIIQEEKPGRIKERGKFEMNFYENLRELHGQKN